MLLKGRNGNEFELAFTKETLPDVQDTTGGGYWTTVSFRVATDDSAWEETAPCINMFEFETLANWLETVAAPAHEDDAAMEGLSGEASGNRAPEGDDTPAIEIPEPIHGDLSEVELLEPELKFSVSQQFRDAVTIRVGFHLEDRPEEFNVDTDTEEALFVDLHMSRENIMVAAQELRASIAELGLIQQTEAPNMENEDDDEEGGLVSGFDEDDPAVINRLADESSEIERIDEDADNPELAP